MVAIQRFNSLLLYFADDPDETLSAFELGLKHQFLTIRSYIHPSVLNIIRFNCWYHKLGP